LACDLKCISSNRIRGEKCVNESWPHLFRQLARIPNDHSQAGLFLKRSLRSGRSAARGELGITNSVRKCCIPFCLRDADRSLSLISGYRILQCPPKAEVGFEPTNNGFAIRRSERAKNAAIDTYGDTSKQLAAQLASKPAK
jgi:hypothetical protein